MEFKRLLRALERDWIVWRPRQHECVADNVTPVKGNRKKMLRRLSRINRKLVREAVKFDLEADMSLDDLNEAVASAQAMHQIGLFNLPYPACYFEAGTTKEGIVSGDERDHTVCVMATETPSGSMDVSAWCAFRNEPRFVDLGSTLIDVAKDTLEITPYVGSFDHDKSGSVMVYVVFVALVLMQTKGVILEDAHKTTLLKRDHPVNAYKRVYIGRSGESSGGGTVPERYRCRLHLRRGHVRNQRYGRNLSRVKQIWIEPTMVGHVTEGVIDHEYGVSR